MAKKPLSKKEVERIVQLRKHGHSLPEIKNITGHGKATIYKYIYNVKILQKFKMRWDNLRRSSVLRMIESQERARAEMQGSIGKLNTRDKVLIISCLYWAEGNKKDFILTNTDPVLIKCFVEYLSEIGVKRTDLRVTIRVYEDINIQEACKFWAGVVGIKANEIRNLNILQGKKKGKLQYGMCRVRVAKGSYFLKLLAAVKDIIGENV
ncbi:MAG TPA: hypothetical protein VK254_02315 [Candidatus Bathyarchaeia archaeon]|nr:hypothetical protein [Candidatus Bathyarchaeia archaeon]